MPGRDCVAWFEPHDVLLDRAPAARGRKGVVIRVSFPASGGRAVLEAGAPTASTTNVFAGADPSAWRTALPTYEAVRYRGVAPGADLVYHAESGRLKYDLVLAPGADLAQARLRYEGARRLEVDPQGGLIVRSAAGPLYEQPPVLYQEIDGARVPVRGGYRVIGHDVLGFWAEGVDAAHALVVDPGVAWSTFLGGSAADDLYGVASDGSGDLYVVGSTASADYPTTVGAYQRSHAAGLDVMVTKLRGDGGAVLWSTFLGGTGDDVGRAVAVDGSGNVYLAGHTYSTNFPVTSGAYRTTFGGGAVDGFVAKLSANGASLLFSTFLGASWDDYPRAIAVDRSGITVAGFTNSVDFPTTSGVVKPTRNPSLFDGSDGFVTKLALNGASLLWSTYLGTNGGTENIMALALDPNGCATVTGWTVSSAFPTTSGAWDRTYDGQQEAFVTRLNATASGYLFSTYLGSTGYDEGYGLAIDSNGDTYVVGRTTSAGFPVTSGAFQRTFGGGNYYDAFVTKLVSNGTALGFSTFLGGAGNDAAYGISVKNGFAVVTGTTESTNFPVTAGALSGVLRGGVDAFLACLDPTGGQVKYGTYLGGTGNDGGWGVAIRPDGGAVAVGYTLSGNFPATSGVIDPTQNSSTSDDGFLSSFDVGISGGQTAVETAAPPTLQMGLPQPNPFRDQTSLSLELAEPTPVRAEIVDLQGRRVATILDAPLGAGIHRLTWDGRDLSGRPAGAGLFYVRVTAGARVATRALIHLQ